MDNAIGSATFAGQVRFEEQGLRARGAEARYDPAKGTLQLLGTDAGGRPQVSDDQVNVDADTIDVTLNGHRMVASGTVKTTLQPETAGRAVAGSPRPGSGTMKLPGLLKSDQSANVSAKSMDYQGASGNAVYTGDATLWQGETAIRAETITLDQGKGNLLATGNARSTIMLSDGASTGRAGEIGFDDATRLISYANPKVPQSPARGRQAPVPAAVQPQLSGPQGDLRADRIELILEKTGGGAERVEAYSAVNVRLDTRVATGARLTFFADEGRYQMSGASAIPVKVVEECREITGKTLTFFKSTDRVIVDGNEEIRTQSKRGEPCAATVPR
jgi:lipopolysaccharide export system protein LptA